MKATTRRGLAPSCAPTASSSAFAIDQEGRASASAKDGAASFQRALLEEFGRVAIPRLESHLAARLKNGLGQLMRAGGATAEVDAELIGWLRQAYEDA